MNKTITVKGVGTAKTKPDFIIISINLTANDTDYSKAVEAANRKIGLLKTAVCGAGFGEDELKTLNFTVNTVYDYQQNKRVFGGYSCDYRLKLSFDLSAEKLAKTLNSIANSGADAEFSICFTVKDPEKVTEELLASAAENARQKANILCRASGKTLGELISIDYNWGEVSFNSPNNYVLAKMSVECDCGGVPEFQPEDISSNDSATFVWEIL